MSGLAALGSVVLGLALLAAGGEALLRGATTVARTLGLTPAVIGLTVVAFGTSMPELVVSVLAGLRGQGDLTVGNVLGSNIINVTAILGATALVAPLPVHATAVRLEWPTMAGASVAALLALRDTRVTRLEGLGLALVLVAYVAYMVRVARQAVSATERAQFAAEVEALTSPPPHGARPGRPSGGRAAGLVVVGAVLLAAGGHALVTGATELALLVGLSERVVGLTVVAVGTSTPELAASLIAARRGQTDVAVANMIGSNTFNALGVLGGAALARPLAVTPGLAASDGWWMLGVTLLVLPVLRTGARVSRREGGLLVAVYAAYVAVLLA